MTNKEYITAYQKTKFSTNSVKSSHEVIRELMFQLSNSLQKIIIDINETSIDQVEHKYISKKEVALKKSKNMSKCLTIIYGLQTSFHTHEFRCGFASVGHLKDPLGIYPTHVVHAFPPSAVKVLQLHFVTTYV